MKSSIFITIDSDVSEYSLARIRESLRHVPGIEKVVPLPDEGPEHLHLAVCEENADFDLVMQKIRKLPHVVSGVRGRVM